MELLSAVKNVLSIIAIIFAVLMVFAIVSQDLGLYIFFLSFLVLITLVKFAWALLEARSKPPEPVSPLFRKSLGFVFLVLGLLILVYIFFQWWRLFFEEQLMPFAHAQEYRGFVESLRLLGYGSLLCALTIVGILLKQFDKKYLAIPAALVLIFSAVAYQSGFAYFPDAPYPPMPGNVFGGPGSLDYVYTRLNGIILFIPFITAGGVFLSQKALDLFRPRQEMKAPQLRSVVTYYLAVLFAEVVGSLALAMALVKG